MLGIIIIGGGVVSLAAGVYIGLGAPGWPVPPRPHERRLEKRQINPIAWGRSSRRERLSPRSSSERRGRLR